MRRLGFIVRTLCGVATRPRANRPALPLGQGPSPISPLIEMPLPARSSRLPLAYQTSSALADLAFEQVLPLLARQRVGWSVVCRNLLSASLAALPSLLLNVRGGNHKRQRFQRILVCVDRQWPRLVWGQVLRVSRRCLRMGLLWQALGNAVARQKRKPRHRGRHLGVCKDDLLHGATRLPGGGRGRSGPQSLCSAVVAS